MVTISFGLVTLNELSKNLIDLLILLSNANAKNDKESIYLLSVKYRRIQVFMIMINECFQTVFWPRLQVLVAMLAIILAYALIMYHQFLDIYIQAWLLVGLTMLVGAFLFILDVGSQPLILSLKVLRQNSNVLRRTICANWFRKFVKSCGPTALKVGPFYKLDRGRGPAFVQLVLQRTIFVVVKSKD